MKTKGPNKPKHSVSVCLFFTLKARLRMRASGAIDSWTAIGELWRSLSMDQRLRFDELVSTDNSRYYREMKACNNS